MRLPKVKVRPGGPDFQALAKAGAVPNEPAFLATLPPPPDRKQGVAEADEIRAATEMAHARLQALTAQMENVGSAAAMRELGELGVASALADVHAEVARLTEASGGGMPVSAPGVEDEVAAFKDRMESAKAAYMERVAGLPDDPDAREAAMRDAASQYSQAVAENAGSLAQNYQGVNAAGIAHGISDLSHNLERGGDFDLSAGIGSLAGIAGAIPGGEGVAEALSLTSTAVKIGQSVNFDKLLSGGGPDLAAAAGVLDMAQDYAMGQLEGMLPPQAQMALGSLKTIMAAYGISMPSLSELAGLKESEPPAPKSPGCYVEGQFIATILNPTTHGSPTLPGPGAPVVLYMGMPVWRCFMDMHLCPIVKGLVPDVGGVVAKGAKHTIVLGSFCARKGDQIMEIPGGPNPIIPMGAAGDNDSDEPDEDEAPDEPDTDDPSSDAPDADSDRSTSNEDTQEGGSTNDEASSSGSDSSQDGGDQPPDNNRDSAGETNDGQNSGDQQDDHDYSKDRSIDPSEDPNHDFSQDRSIDSSGTRSQSANPQGDAPTSDASPTWGDRLGRIASEAGAGAESGAGIGGIAGVYAGGVAGGVPGAALLGSGGFALGGISGAVVGGTCEAVRQSAIGIFGASPETAQNIAGVCSFGLSVSSPPLKGITNEASSLAGGLKTGTDAPSSW